MLMLKIKNLNELGTTSIRKTALKIVEAGLLAIDTSLIIEKKIRVDGDSVIIDGVPFRTSLKSKIYLVGIGKCSSEAAFAVENILLDKLSGGIVLDVREPEKIGTRVKYYCGTHPFPSEKNTSITTEIVEFLKKLDENDLVIFIISGGGSTLLCLPNEGNTCIEE